MTGIKVWLGTPYPLGATWRDNGVNFAVYSENATGVDLCLFDPAKILDHASYTDPFQYNDGVEYVIVNGQLVLNRGTHTGARPGSWTA